MLENKKHIRIIPRLDIKGPNLVKGIHLEGLRVLGEPENFALHYYEDTADELIYIDIVASLYGRNNLTNIVRRTAENIFIPLTVGGGIRTIEDIRNILRCGADKVAINTAAIKNPRLISEGAKIFGSQCIVISIEAERMSNGRYEAYTDNGRERTGRDVLEWVRQAEDLGAGEFLVTSIDREGTGRGFDIDLISMITDTVRIPVIACGGAGRLEDFSEIILKGKVDAVSAASVFHYHYLKMVNKSIGPKEEGNIEYLKSISGGKKSTLGKINTFSIPELKTYLVSNKINCRVLLQESECIKQEF